jgi:hypothetical protein
LPPATVFSTEVLYAFPTVAPGSGSTAVTAIAVLGAVAEEKLAPTESTVPIVMILVLLNEWPGSAALTL